METFTYTIGGVCYTQTPLVLGQTVQLSKALSSLEGNIDDFNDFLAVAGDKMPELLAIVLTPEGTAKKDKNITELAAVMSEHATLEVMEAVVTDFFTCNPNISSLLEKIDKATGIVGEMVGKMTLKFLSSAYASSLQTATSPSETESSGDSDQMSFNFGSNTDSDNSSSAKP